MDHGKLEAISGQKHQSDSKTFKKSKRKSVEALSPYIKSKIMPHTDGSSVYGQYFVYGQYLYGSGEKMHVDQLERYARSFKVAKSELHLKPFSLKILKSYTGVSLHAEPSAWLSGKP